MPPANKSIRLRVGANLGIVPSDYFLGLNIRLPTPLTLIKAEKCSLEDWGNVDALQQGHIQTSFSTFFTAIFLGMFF
jgi:hypothetical protein